MNDTNTNITSAAKNEGETTAKNVDEYDGATVTLPLKKLMEIVSECVAAKVMNDEWTTKYWMLHAEKEALKKQLDELRREL